MSTITAPTLTPPEVPADPFYYGYRDVPRELPDGRTVFERVPLTLEDCLHPQEGDKIVEGSLHSEICKYIADVFQSKLNNDPHAVVLANTGVYWDDEVLDHHSPDVAVILNVPRPRKEYPSFNVVQEEARPALIIEVVSPRTRSVDVVDKFRDYHQAGVRRYVIVDRVGDERRLVGYQYTPSKYLTMPCDETGRLWLEAVGVWLGIVDNQVVCFDGVTNQPIGDYKKITAELANAEARIRELEEQLKRLNG